MCSSLVLKLRFSPIIGFLKIVHILGSVTLSLQITSRNILECVTLTTLCKHLLVRPGVIVGVVFHLVPTFLTFMHYLNCWIIKWILLLMEIFTTHLLLVFTFSLWATFDLFTHIRLMFNFEIDLFLSKYSCSHIGWLNPNSLLWFEILIMLSRSYNEFFICICIHIA